MVKQKIILPLVSITIFIVIVMASIIIFNTSCYENKTVFSVNGEAVSVREFSMVMSTERGNVYSYFTLKYGISDGKDFWKTNCDGEVPSEVLKSRVLESLTKIKIEQALFKQYGLITTASYDNYLKLLKQENIRRQEALKMGQPIYGPKQYEEQSYYFALHGNRIEDLKKKLSENEPHYDDYDELVDNLVKEADVKIDDQI